MPQNLTPDELLALAGEVLDIESRAVISLRSRLGQDFVAACDLCLDTPGRIVVTGMGKSGHIAGKIAATLASTGTPAFFMHGISIHNIFRGTRINHPICVIDSVGFQVWSFYSQKGGRRAIASRARPEVQPADPTGRSW